jgi:hypothetical protein
MRQDSALPLWIWPLQKWGIEPIHGTYRRTKFGATNRRRTSDRNLNPVQPVAGTPEARVIHRVRFRLPG